MNRLASLDTMEDNQRPSVILMTAATLLGFCFIVLTSTQIAGMRDSTWIDDITSLSIAVFMGSSLLAFMAMRGKGARANRYEKAADVLFLVGLFIMFAATVLVTFNILA